MNKTILVKELRALLDALQEDDLLFVNAHGDLGALRTEPGGDDSLAGVINMNQGAELKDRWGKPFTHMDAYLLQRNSSSGQIEKRYFQAKGMEDNG